MGAPKQKWTPEEESALLAGISKHGSGKWSTILKDPEFSHILFSRSNVDLKDKWRNICVIPSGRAPRERSAIAVTKSRQVPKLSSNPMALSTVDEVIDAKPLAMSAGPPQITTPKKTEAKLATLILEAITNSKEPTVSHKTAIAMYIEENYVPPPDFKQVLSGELQRMTETGTLIKVKHNYRIAPTSDFSQGRSSKVLREGKQREPSIADRGEIKRIDKLEVDADLARMEFMTSQEAAEAAARALAEAEVATAEADEAMRLAETAEAYAEEAVALAEAASLALKNRNAAMMVHLWKERGKRKRQNVNAQVMHVEGKESCMEA